MGRAAADPDPFGRVRLSGGGRPAGAPPRRGLALASLQASLDHFLAHDHPPTVYCWIYSEDGRRFLPAVRRWLAARELVLLERRPVAATRSRVPPAPGG